MLPNLTFLDDNPVTIEERLLVQAYFNGGQKAVQNQRILIQIQKYAQDEKDIAMNAAFLDGKTKDECIKIGQQMYDKIYNEELNKYQQQLNQQETQPQDQDDQIPQLEEINVKNHQIEK